MHGAEDFFGRDEVTQGCQVWNHMTYCIVEKQQWLAWREVLGRLTGNKRIKRIEACRKIIKKCLQEFRFIGLHEDFERSCNFMFRIMGQNNVPLRWDHSVDTLSANLSHFRRVEKPPVTPAIEIEIAGLIELDNIVYEEAKVLYEKIFQPPKPQSDIFL